MRSTNTFTIILSMATSVVRATSDIQARDEAPPLVRLYLEQDGAEVYSPLFAFDDKCHSKLLDYGGIWINKDTRADGDRQGCAYASTSDVCNDDMDWDPISLTFSATDVTRVSFTDSQVGDAGKSFKFTTAPCGQALHEVTSVVVPTQR